ncbi:hypothetical protein JW848_00520 [Candidatus Bipolaricaulota bacterium]|nr:hypothetical protein [Candidatus Bipolaricaulota bacterium]
MLQKRLAAMQAANRVSLILVVGLLVCAQCASCQSDPWQEDPFEWAQSELNPTTVGLPAGSAAPAIEGVEFSDRQTVVHIAVGAVRDEAIALLRSWAECDDLQVVVAFAGVGLMQSAEILSALGERIVAFGPPNGLRPVADYLVGAGVNAVTFLIDEAGTIVYRFTWISLKWAGMIDRAVASFASTGEIPGEAPQEAVYWFDDVLRWPEVPLTTLDGESVTLTAGKPRLLFEGSCVESGQMAVVREALDGLRTEFPHVEFVLVAHVLSDDTSIDMWTHARALGLAATFAGFQGSVDAYLEESVAYHREIIGSLTDCAATHLQGWRVFVDADSRFARELLLLASPMILIVDADGRVAFPPTILVSSAAGGNAQLHPQAIPALRAILEQLTEP